MKELEIDKEKELQEKKIIEELYSHIDAKESFIFYAGAGAGKTYALLQCLKYVVSKYGKSLAENNQRIMCITYTNVAANNIKQQMGNSQLVMVSTIHERIWNLIEGHQKELVELHRNKLEKEIENKKGWLNGEENSDLITYNALDSDQKELFRKKMIELKEFFYGASQLGAKDFKEKFAEHLMPGQKIASASNFQKIVRTIYSINENEKCLENIEKRAANYRRVTYDARYNTDRLHRMKISHDTLLEYGSEMIETYPILCRIIIDQYPFVFIDEYQDTDAKVVNIMKNLDLQSKNLQHDFVVGYYGDSVQNIYEEGIGEEIENAHTGLQKVKKLFNRRSCEEVIAVANRVRNDELVQESIYKNYKGGNVEVIYGEMAIEDIYEKYKVKWSDGEDKRLHCFLLKNETVAAYSGFENIYDAFKNTEHYSGYGYKQLNSELMSNDIEKLGKIPEVLNRVIKLYIELQNEKTPLSSVFMDKEELYPDSGITALRNVLNNLKNLKGACLDDFLKSIGEKYSTAFGTNEKALLDAVFGIEAITYNKVIDKFIEELGRNQNDNEELFPESIQRILQISMEEWEKWYRFIHREYSGDIVYHTFHGTKGLEFDNVLIVLDNRFNRKTDYFNNYFDNYNVNPDEAKYKEVRNLLYVAVTRAKKNLIVQVPENIARPYEDIINQIFGSRDDE